MELSNVSIKMPPNEGNCAVIAEATPNKISDTSPNTCSRTKMMTAMTGERRGEVRGGDRKSM